MWSRWGRTHRRAGQGGRVRSTASRMWTARRWRWHGRPRPAAGPGEAATGRSRPGAPAGRSGRPAASPGVGPGTVVGVGGGTSARPPRGRSRCAARSPRPPPTGEFRVTSMRTTARGNRPGNSSPPGSATVMATAGNSGGPLRESARPPPEFPDRRSPPPAATGRAVGWGATAAHCSATAARASTCPTADRPGWPTPSRGRDRPPAAARTAPAPGPGTRRGGCFGGVRGGGDGGRTPAPGAAVARRRATGTGRRRHTSRSTEPRRRAAPTGRAARPAHRQRPRLPGSPPGLRPPGVPASVQERPSVRAPADRGPNRPSGRGPGPGRSRPPCSPRWNGPTGPASRCVTSPPATSGPFRTAAHPDRHPPLLLPGGPQASPRATDPGDRPRRPLPKGHR
ncbi:hypothetical protein K353_02441 [Kitasatospora sp. SolWspMP-SS2h]|nr:hypothetical protein K353_02441 [Kitasatospora sp. SolWspMP-SS2h]